MPIIAPVPILFCAVVTVLISGLWYHPNAFGAPWLRLSGMTPERVERARTHVWKFALTAFVASMVVAYVMGYFEILSDTDSWQGALGVGLLCWAGFCAPPMLGMVLWEQEAFKLYLIDALYWLLAFSVISLILFYTAL